jgi:uncharacterized protein YhaN
MVEHTTDALIKIADNLQSMNDEADKLKDAHNELSRVREHIVHIHDAVDRLNASTEPYAIEIVNAIMDDLEELIND